MYAGQYRNNPVIDNSLSFSKLIKAVKTIPKLFITCEPSSLQVKTPAQTVLLITPLGPWLTVSSDTKVTLFNKCQKLNKYYSSIILFSKSLTVENNFPCF